MSHSMRLLCYYSGTIINTDNDITYNRGSNEFFTCRLYMSFFQLKIIIIEALDGGFLKLKLKWKIQAGTRPNFYVDVFIFNDANFKKTPLVWNSLRFQVILKNHTNIIYN